MVQTSTRGSFTYHCNIYCDGRIERRKYYWWLDGLAAGVSAIIGAAIGVFVYVSGNYKFADYLNIMYIPNLAELSVFIGAFVGACIGFCGTMLTRRRCSWAIPAVSRSVALLFHLPLLCVKNCWYDLLRCVPNRAVKRNDTGELFQIRNESTARAACISTEPMHHHYRTRFKEAR